MFKQLIETAFASYKTIDASIAKDKFGYIWFAFADKLVRFSEFEIDLSWRDSSKELAEIFNKWYNAKFTTDAFYYCVQNAYYGMNATYTEVIDKLRAMPGFIGIFEVEITPFSSAHPTVLIREHNIVDGKDRFVKHEVRSKTNHQKVEITEAEYKEIMGVK